MFLILSILVVCAVFWLSVLVAEIVLTSAEENSLHPGIRVGFGYFVSVVYFSAAWQIMTIQHAWLLGWALILLYGYGKGEFSGIKIIKSGVKSVFSQYLNTFFIFIAGTILFFAPLLISKNFGPFTEGSGDITIYADVPQFLTKNQMTAFGQKQPSPSDSWELISRILKFSNEDRFDKYSNVTQPFVEKNKSKLNPPEALYPVNRIVADVFFLSSYYAPFAQFYFLSGKTNYHVFFGIQSFLYTCILIGVWNFISNFNKKTACVALLITASSHGLISIFYNFYSLQYISIAITALTLVAVVSVPFFSWAGFRLYGLTWSYIIICYSHFAAIISPLILISIFLLGKSEVIEKNRTKTKNSQEFSFYLSIFILAFLFFLYSASGFFQASNIIKFAFKIKEQVSVYFGDSIAIFSFKWFSFLFGFLSQQHYQPFSIEVPLVQTVIKIGVFAGIISLAAGIFLIMKISTLSTDYFMGKKRLFLAIYGTIFVVAAIHYSLLNSSLYVQAKNFQNLLILVYIGMTLPLAIASQVRNGGNQFSTVKNILVTSLAIFFIALLIPRVIYTFKIANNTDRASILETSYFNEIQRVQDTNPNSFFLFEPRKSADLYLGNQPLFEQKILPTRHLVIQKVNVIPYRPGRKRQKSDTQVILASDIIKSDNLPNIWQLKATQKTQGFIWNANKLTDQKQPTIILFADNYEQNLKKRKLKKPLPARMFSYLKNGAAMLYLPSGFSGELEVTLEPKGQNNHESLAREIKKRIRNNEFGEEVEIKITEKFVILNYNLVFNSTPTLKTVARYSSEFWFNAQVNGKDL